MKICRILILFCLFVFLWERDVEKSWMCGTHKERRKTTGRNRMEEEMVFTRRSFPFSTNMVSEEVFPHRGENPRRKLHHTLWSSTDLRDGQTPPCWPMPSWSRFLFYRGSEIGRRIFCFPQRVHFFSLFFLIVLFGCMLVSHGNAWSGFEEQRSRCHWSGANVLLLPRHFLCPSNGLFVSFWVKSHWWES